MALLASKHMKERILSGKPRDGIQENDPEVKEHPYPSHWATRNPQLRNHCRRPDRAPLHFGMDISEAYMGIVLVSMPTATPPMERPAMSMGMLVAPAWRADPKSETTEPEKMVILRPIMSAKN
jgi:hypothetical protein